MIVGLIGKLGTKTAVSFSTLAVSNRLTRASDLITPDFSADRIDGSTGGG